MIIIRNKRREREREREREIIRRRRKNIRKAAEGDMILKVAEPVVGALGRRRRRVCWGLEVLPLMSGFWTKQ
eukprot:1033481-Heterocapsa_arctica.AAC.1